jgi:prepilin-type N-terminal cleavage/methylation domain-containing protein
MKTISRHKPAQAAFTLVEVLISLSVVTMVMAMAMSTFLHGIRMMYKDNQRLATNTNLRYFMAQVAKATLDASEFYIYPNYLTLDGDVDSVGDLTTAVTDSYGLELYHGDCLVLVTRTSLDQDSNIRQVSVYYRTTSDPAKEGSLRYFEGKDYGEIGTTDTLDTLLNEINLKEKPEYTGSRLLSTRTLGRPKEGKPSERYPIFCSKTPFIETENYSVSINAEVINVTTVNNLLSSSSFNYTISPRR